LKIGIIRTSSVGDVVLATAVIDYMLRVSPDAGIVWVGRKPSSDLVKISYPHVQVLDLPSKAPRTVVEEVYACLATCNAVIDLQTNGRSRNLVRRLRKAGVAVASADKEGFSRMKIVIESWLRGRLLRLQPTAANSLQHQFKMMLKAAYSALEMVGFRDSIALESARPRLAISARRIPEGAWTRELEFGQWLGVAPGASYPTKRAPTEVFRDVLLEFKRSWPQEKSAPGLLLVGGQEDRSSAVSLVDDIHWPGPVINIAGKLSLEETAYALSKTSILLCNDSGLAHMTEALGLPVAVLFGPTHEAFGFWPHGKTSAFYASSLGCRPCSKHGKTACRYGDQLCFQTIDVRSVARHLNRVLLQGDLL
jgi:ADP-heptose:LPS heptosyltransferase